MIQWRPEAFLPYFSLGNPSQKWETFPRSGNTFPQSGKPSQKVGKPGLDALSCGSLGFVMDNSAVISASVAIDFSGGQG